MYDRDENDLINGASAPFFLIDSNPGRETALPCLYDVTIKLNPIPNPHPQEFQS